MNERKYRSTSKHTTRRFPESWKTDEIMANGVSLDSSEMERSITVLKKALDKYPVSLLTTNISRIYVLQSMEFFGQRFGGTNSTDVVYIANNGVWMGYTDEFIEMTFHHEFSSILLRNFPEFFDESEWTSVNSIPYGEGGVQALKDETDSVDFEPSLHERGFLHLYATSSMENDLNSFAENVFCPTDEFYDAVKSFKTLTHKLALTLEFYARLDSSFTVEYFRDLKQ